MADVTKLQRRLPPRAHLARSYTFHLTISSFMVIERISRPNAVSLPHVPQEQMNRKAVLASLKEITHASGRAYVALSKGDTAAYLNAVASIEQSLAAIHADHRVRQENVRYHAEEDS